jgi:hypothetical protein
MYTILVILKIKNKVYIYITHARLQIRNRKTRTDYVKLFTYGKHDKL